MTSVYAAFRHIEIEEDGDEQRRGKIFCDPDVDGMAVRCPDAHLDAHFFA